MFKKDNILNLVTTWLLFGIIYGGIITILWDYLFAPQFNFSISFLQGFGIHTMSRILFGNTITNYISNFYSTQPLDMSKVDEKIREMKEEADADVVEEYKNEDEG
jgi:hypothetical protein